MYRPEGWDKILSLIRKKYFDGYYGWEEPEVIAEAGADAMHKADIEWLLDHIEEDWNEVFEDSYGQKWVKVIAFFFDEEWQELQQGLT